ncbi:DNA polymerase iota [Discoglossus pictus]
MDSPSWDREEDGEQEDTDWMSRDEDPDPSMVQTKPPSAQFSRNLGKSVINANRVIMHIDMDCFYAQVEMIRNPTLRDKPLGVQQKNIVVTCNYEARRQGVNKLMYIKDAKEKCPQLVLVSGEDLTHYRETSYSVTELLEEFSPKVERLGFDENFIDITDLVDKKLLQEQENNLEMSVCGHVYNDQMVNVNDGTHMRIAAGSRVAAEIRAAVHSRLGLTGCAGVATNKLLSKLVGGTFKPNQQTVLLPESCGHLISSLSHVGKIPGIGYKTAKRLESLGLSSLLDLQSCPLTVLEKELGRVVAQRIQMLSRGEDDSPVTPTGPPQSLSDEDSFKKCFTVSEVKIKMKELLNSLLPRVTKDGRTPHTLRLTIRQFSPTNKWFNRESRQCPVPSNISQHLGSGDIDVTDPLVELLMKLFEKMINVKQPFHLTLLNICFSNLKSSQSTKKSIGFYLTQMSQLPSSTSQRRLETESTMKDILVNECRTPEFFKTEKQSIKDNNTSHKETKGILNRRSSYLPEDIDMDVFSQLPEEIKNEIISSPRIARAHQSGQTSRSSASSRGILDFFNKSKVEHSPIGPMKDGHSSLLKGHPIPFKADVNKPTRDGSSSSDHLGDHIKEPVDPVMSTMTVADNSSTVNILLNTDNEVGVTMDCMELTTETPTPIPSSVDVNVFSQLPEEVQKELMAEWKQQKHTSKIQVKKPEKTKNTKGKNTPTLTKTNSVLKYFKPG